MYHYHVPYPGPEPVQVVQLDPSLPVLRGRVKNCRDGGKTNPNYLQFQIRDGHGKLRQSESRPYPDFYHKMQKKGIEVNFNVLQGGLAVNLVPITYAGRLISIHQNHNGFYLEVQRNYDKKEFFSAYVSSADIDEKWNKRNPGQEVEFNVDEEGTARNIRLMT